MQVDCFFDVFQILRKTLELKADQEILIIFVTSTWRNVLLEASSSPLNSLESFFQVETQMQKLQMSQSLMTRSERKFARFTKHSHVPTQRTHLNLLWMRIYFISWSIKSWTWCRNQWPRCLKNSKMMTSSLNLVFVTDSLQDFSSCNKALGTWTYRHHLQPSSRGTGNKTVVICIPYPCLGVQQKLWMFVYFWIKYSGEKSLQTSFDTRQTFFLLYISWFPKGEFLVQHE